MAQTGPSGGVSEASDDGPAHVLTVDDLDPAPITELVDDAAARPTGDGTDHAPLTGQTVAMLFEKPSTRTRVSFETGVAELGGNVVFMGPGDTQLERGEPLKDTARALSRYVDAIVARVHDHATVEELAAYASVPVVNGLSDRAHPCQALADLCTVRDVAGTLDGATATWVGDGNNVARSFALACAAAGVDLTVATPPGYGLDDDTLAQARTLGGEPTLSNEPAAAVAGSDVVYTDVWVSMGDDDRATRLADFEAFRVDADLLSYAPGAAVMHCLPAHRGEEITDAVLEGDRSVVFQQAENRLHAQNALLVALCGDGGSVRGDRSGDR